MNEKCLLCNRNLNYKVDLEWLFSVAKIQEQFICEDCQKRFVKIEGPTCLGCGKIQANLCADCQRWQRKKKKLLHNKALYVYQNQAMKEFFKQYKFMGNYHLRKFFKLNLKRLFKKGILLKSGSMSPFLLTKRLLTRECLIKLKV